MKHTLFFVGTLSLIAIGTQAQPTPDNYQAQGGTHIGRIFIGDTRAAVGRRLGKPTRTFDLGRTFDSQLWRSKKSGDQGARNTLEVVYKSGTVTQIEATSLVFKTPAGLSLSSSRTEWQDRYGAPSISTYDFDGGTRKRYLDWKTRGIALELVSAARNAESNPDNWTYQTLIVHQKGFAVIPDRGGERE